MQGPISPSLPLQRPRRDLSLARHHERELRRRARERVGTVDEFRTRRRQFEDTWYGNHPTDESRVAEWLRQLEAPR